MNRCRKWKVVLVAEHGRNVVDVSSSWQSSGGFKKQFTFIGDVYRCAAGRRQETPVPALDSDAYAKVRLQHLQVLGRLVDGTAFTISITYSKYLISIDNPLSYMQLYIVPTII